jgi:uncharacterized membrane protein
MNAPRSIDEYLKQLRAALGGDDPALTQDALYDAEEYLRAEVAAHPQKSEADVLELIATTYGAPEEVAAAYRDTEVKVKAALQTPAPKSAASPSALTRFFGVFLDPRAYGSLFYMLLALATGIIYFTFVVVGTSLSLGFAILIIGIPFFLAFIGIARAIALGHHRGAHAAAPGASGCERRLVGAHRGHAQGRAYLDHARLPGADAAPGHRLLRHRRRRAQCQCGLHRHPARAPRPLLRLDAREHSYRRHQLR